jgi:hypothetical protein
MYAVIFVTGGSIPGRSWEFFSSPRVQTDSGAHPASCPRGTRGSFFWGKAGGAWSLLHRLLPGSRMRGAIPTYPNMLSWHGAQLKHRDNFTFTLPLFLVWSSVGWDTLSQIREQITPEYSIPRMQIIINMLSQFNPFPHLRKWNVETNIPCYLQHNKTHCKAVFI